MRPRRRSTRLQKSNEQSLRKEERRRALVGRQGLRWPAPADVPEGELHVYTDGSAKNKRDIWKAGCGVWFGDKSPFNIRTSPRGKQTVNRAELTAIILAIRKAMHWSEPFDRLVIHSDSFMCVKGINEWIHTWKLDGWTRSGKPLKNADLWKLMYRILMAVKAADFDLCVRHVPAHVGIVGNERADRLAKAAMRMAHRAAARTSEQIEESRLTSMADALVATLTTDHEARQQETDRTQAVSQQNDPLQWRWEPCHLRGYFANRR